MKPDNIKTICKEKRHYIENKASLSTKCQILTGSDFRHSRNTKKFKNFEGDRMPMKKGKYGYDYTPLVRFLLSKAGKDWDVVFSEVKERLDKTEPIFWLVKFSNDIDIQPIVYVGEGKYYHTLIVDDNILTVYNKTATLEDGLCSCHTHTLDGKVIKSKNRKDN
jgi:hypothetical protein